MIERNLSGVLSRAACFFGALIIPAIIALALLCTAMPMDRAMRGILGSWPYLRDQRMYLAHGVDSNERDAAGELRSGLFRLRQRHPHLLTRLPESPDILRRRFR